MSFLDEFKRLARPYEDEESDEMDEEEDFTEDNPAAEDSSTADRSARRSERRERSSDTAAASSGVSDRRSGKVVNIHTTTQLQVVLAKPEKFENAAEIADHLRDKRTVVLNLESTNKDIARRLLDFLSGVAYANEGKIKKVAASTYIITPYNVDILGDLIDELENNGLYF